MQLLVGNIFRMEGSHGKAGYGGGFEMDSESCGYLGGTPRWFGVSSFWYESSFNHYKCPPLPHLSETVKGKSREQSGSEGFSMP